MSTETLLQEEVVLEEKTKKENHIVLYNDDVNTFDHVIDLLIKVCKHDKLQAEQCAMIVHYNGKCSVKNGELEELKVLSEILAENDLTVEIN